MEEAVAYYRVAFAINPASRDIYNALGSLYFKDLPRYGAAAENLYKQGVAMFPQERDLWNNLGYYYAQEKKWTEAYDAYHKALEIDPEFELARRNLAVAAQNSPGRTPDELLSLPALFQNVDRLIDAKRLDEAHRQVQEILRISPRSFRGYFLLGNVEYFLGRLPEAEKAYRQSLVLQPAAATTWQNLGVTLDRLGRGVEAEAAFRKTLELDPQNAQAKARLRIP
jgi:tetratricopeptide (TPR) repeat protein